LSLFCNTPNDIWVGGDNGFISNHNGTIWKKDNIKIKFNDHYFINGIVKYNNEIFAIISSYRPNDVKFYFVKGTLHNWNIVDSLYYDGKNFNVKWGYYGLFKSSDNNLYSYGPGGVWQWNGSNWIQTLKLNYTMKGLYALDYKYVFALSDYGLVYFFDSTNWTQLTKFAESPTVIFTDAWTNGYEAFILGHTIDGWPQKTVIWRGK
jgi:hypothetical protein